MSSSSTGSQSRGRGQPMPVFLKQMPFEHVFHTGSSSNYKSIFQNGLWAGGLNLRRTRQACFFQKGQEMSSRQRTIDKKELDDEWCCRRTVIAQTTNAFVASTHDLLNMQTWCFIKVAVTLLLCTQFASKSTRQCCQFCRRDCHQAGGDSSRADRPTHTWDATGRGSGKRISHFLFDKASL